MPFHRYPGPDGLHSLPLYPVQLYECALNLLLSALLVILLVVIIVKHEEKRRLERETESQIFDIASREDLKTLTLDDSDGEKTVFYFNESHNVSKITRNGTDFEAEMLNTGTVNNWIDSILRFAIEKSFDTPAEGVSAYGLSSPTYTIVAEKTDGTQALAYAGDLVSDQTGVYVKVLVAPYSFYKFLNTNFENFLNRIVLSLERSEVDEISFERTSTKDRWVAVPLADYDNGIYIEPRYKVTYPMQRDPNDTMYNLLAMILNLEVSQYVPIAEEDMAAYGLADPEYKITIRLQTGEEIKIALSMELGGYYYGSCSNNPYTFRVDPSYLPGLNKTSFELIDSYVIHGYLDDVSTVQATIKDKSFVLECRMNQDLDFTADDSMFQLDKRNAKVYSSSGDCDGLLLFESLFNMPVSRVDYDAKPDLKNVEASFKISKHSGEITELKLVPLADDEYYCFINDYYSGFIVDRSVLYKDNGHDLSGFGVWDAYCLATEAIDNKNGNNIYDRP